MWRKIKNEIRPRNRKITKENEGTIILAKNVEKYIEKLEKLGYSFILYVKNEKDELEEIYRYKGKNTEETKSCLECTSCANRKEQEENI